MRGRAEVEGWSTHPVSTRMRLSAPRYRVEERSPDLATLIVGFADTSVQYQNLVALRGAQLMRARAAEELVVINQETEAIVMRRDVWVTPES